MEGLSVHPLMYAEKLEAQTMQQSDWSMTEPEQIDTNNLAVPGMTQDGPGLLGRQARLSEYLGSVEKDVIVRALRDANHNQTRAAKRLGISRRGLIYKMEKYGLKNPPSSRRPQPTM